MSDKTDSFLHSQTKENLMRAFAGESQARSRYAISAALRAFLGSRLRFRLSPLLTTARALVFPLDSFRVL